MDVCSLLFDVHSSIAYNSASVAQLCLTLGPHVAADGAAAIVVWCCTGPVSVTAGCSTTAAVTTDSVRLRSLLFLPLSVWGRRAG